MVALRAQTGDVNPVTGVPGIWFQRTGDTPNTWVGVSKADLQALPTGGGSAAQRRATWITNAVAAIQAQLGPGYAVTVVPTASAPFDLADITITEA